MARSGLITAAEQEEAPLTGLGRDRLDAVAKRTKSREQVKAGALLLNPHDDRER